jgi:hypothetical protein
MIAENWNISSIFDSIALVGTFPNANDQHLWNKQTKLELGVFFTDNKEDCAFGLLALIKQGLSLHGLIE